MPQAQDKTQAGPTFSLIAFLALLIGSLHTADMFLAKVERSDQKREAARFFREGTQLLRQSQSARAVDSLRKAYVAERENRQYQLQLVSALMTDQQLDEAGKTLEDLLRRDPNNGEANLLSARLMIQKNSSAEAEPYFHRAIYGAWPGNAALHTMETRLELADFLASRANAKGLLAELLTLEGEAPKDPAARKHIARMFIVAGSPARAVSAYRELIEDYPNDSEASAGLGEAELARGNYLAAQAAFQRALHKNPDDANARRDSQLANTLTALDPTPRRLSSIEKYKRSISILERAANSLKHCGAETTEVAQTLAAVDKALPKKALAAATNELAEEKLTLAGQVWKVRTRLCGKDAETDDEPLRLILEKLDQQ